MHDRGSVPCTCCGVLSMNKMILYHTSFEVIRYPQIDLGRSNADFGQGFYLTPDAEFAVCWARERKGLQTVINRYALDPDGLQVHCFSRDMEWFEYIFENRSSRQDRLAADVIAGPIANDTIYETFGIVTSGFLKAGDALRLLLIGPEYHQVALKSRKAVQQLTWLSARTMSSDETAAARAAVEKEEEIFQKQFAREIEKMTGSVG